MDTGIRGEGGVAGQRMAADRVNHEILGNPVWASLCGNHRHFALGAERVKRYPREMGPFVAMGSAEAVESSELSDLIGEDEEVYIVGAIPERLEGVQVLSRYSVLQMVCNNPASMETGGPEISLLGDESVREMRALTALVYPRFFRSRTHEIGSYFGIWEDGKLAAMAGVRMSAGEYREVSGVCTHPDFRRRGYSKKLIARVLNRILEEGNLPFLHVDADHEKGIALYRSLGFVDANVVPMVLLRRPCSA